VSSASWPPAVRAQPAIPVIGLLNGQTSAASPSVCWPLAAPAQQRERMRRIGVLMLYPDDDQRGRDRAGAFEQTLDKLGWTVGRNVQIDYHWGIGDPDWVRSAITQLLRLSPDLSIGTSGD
jgi:putative ABC transport system substrate-binding protein